MTRFIQALGGPALVCGVAWTFGFDFDQRGYGAALTFTWSVVAFFAIYLFPKD